MSSHGAQIQKRLFLTAWILVFTHLTLISAVHNVDFVVFELVTLLQLQLNICSSFITMTSLLVLVIKLFVQTG